MKQRLFILSIAIWMCISVSASSAQNSNPVTLHIPANAPEYIDPAIISFSHEVDVAINLFISLVRNSPTEHGAIEPSLAERWEISADGLQYTFYLRDDVPWVHYDPSTNEIIPLRFVNAADVVYSVQRVCSDWRNGYYAVDVVGPIIVGCEQALDGGDPTQVAVEALDDYTVQFSLKEPGSYFLSLVTLWTLSPVPHEAIEEYGNSWTQIGNLVTSGPFVLSEWDVDRMVFLRNPYLPEGVSGPGNVQRVIATPDTNSFTDFENGLLERSSTSSSEFQRTHPDQVVFFPEVMVSYLGISNDKPPMDNVHVRRAFSAAISRTAYIEQIEGGEAKPMYHFAPEELFGGLLGTEVGVGFDLDYARAELAAAGYPNCSGLPTIEAYVWNGDIADFLLTQFAALGCTPDQLELTAVDSAYDTIDPTNFAPAEARPHLWSAGWGPDYADADNYMMLLSCGVNNSYRRECTENDDLITVARQSEDLDERIAYYRELQEAFFGEEGEFPLIPLASRIEPRAIAPDFYGPHETNGIVGGDRFDFYSVGDAPAYTALVPEFAEIVANVPPTPQASTTTETTVPTVTASSDFSTINCTVHVIIPQRVNFRVGAGLDQQWVGFLPRGVEHRVVDQAKDKFNMTWWQLESGYWVRHDIVGESDDCPE